MFEVLQVLLKFYESYTPPGSRDVHHNGQADGALTTGYLAPALRNVYGCYWSAIPSFYS